MQRWNILGASMEFWVKLVQLLPLMWLSLVESFSTPVLLYGFDNGCLSNAQIERLNYAFISIYTKLFATFDKLVNMQCQFYTVQLPLNMFLIWNSWFSSMVYVILMIHLLNYYSTGLELMNTNQLLVNMILRALTTVQIIATKYG